MTDFNTFEKDKPEYVKIFNEKLYQAKNGRTPQQVYDEDLTHTERTFVDILGMKPGAQQTSNGNGLGATPDTSLDRDASYTSLSEQSGLGTGNGFLSTSRPDFSKGVGFGRNQGLSDGTGFGRNANNGFNQNTTTNNNPWSGLDTTTRPVANNSKYEWSNIPTFLSDMKSGEYRTRASDVSPTWGNGSANRINKKLASGEFSQEPAGISSSINRLKESYSQTASPYLKAGILSTGLTLGFDMGTMISEPISDFLKALKIRNSKIVGADRMAHCTANYNATNRGSVGKAMAPVLSAGKELWDSYSKGFNVQDSSDDWAANMRGINGAISGQTVQEACPPNPRYYLK